MEFHPVLERLDRFLEAKPTIPDDVYVAPNATILGKVSIRSGSSVWFQCVIRADINEIRIGEKTNIQDGSILHVADQYGLIDRSTSSVAGTERFFTPVRSEIVS